MRCFLILKIMLHPELNMHKKQWVKICKQGGK